MHEPNQTKDRRLILSPYMKNKGNNHLLVISIDEYLHCSKLNNAVMDGRAVSEILEDKYLFLPENITTLFDQNATWDGIDEALKKCAQEIKKPDNLVIYFSGHGHFEPETEMAYLVPVEAHFNKIRDYYSYNRLMRIIKSIDSHHTLLIVDSCYSGAVLVRDIRSDMEKLERDPSRWILASGRNEVVSDGDVGNNSPFADELIDVLKRYSGDGLNVMELVNKVTTSVANNANQTPIGCPLRDVGDKGGQFIFHPRRSETRDWKQAKEINTIEAFDEFVRLYPESDFVEDAYWEMALIFNVKRAFRDYRDKFPFGKYQEESLQKLAYLDEKDQFESARKKGEAALTIFVENFPNGFFAEEARTALNDIIAIEEEPQIWAETKRKGTLKAYNDYLRQFPQSKNAVKAKEELEKLKAKTIEEPSSNSYSPKTEKPVQPEVNTPDAVIKDSIEGKIVVEKASTGESNKKLLLLGGLILFGILLFIVIANLNRPIEYYDMVVVPAGSFQMGDMFEEGFDNESPQHLVRLDSFYISPTEVSVEEFAAFIKDTKYKTDADEEGGSDVWTGRTWKKQIKANWRYDVQGDLRPKHMYHHPVVHVSWNDAIHYCNWLSKKHKLQPVYEILDDQVTADWKANGYRLPTEAEWEFAARSGGKNTRFGNGKDIADPIELVFDGSLKFKKSYSVEGFFHNNTFPVDSMEGSKNPLGIYHMSGNVWEWCWDRYTEYTPEELENPHGADTNQLRMVRGGGWRNFPGGLRVSRRFKTEPTNRNVSIGFRIARNL